MTKTNFINGTIVEPEFLNSIYNTTGGHKHSNQSSDGHASEVDLESEVTGILPAEKIGAHLHNGEGNQEQIDLSRDVKGYSSGKIDMSFIGFSGGNIIVPVIWQKQILNDDGEALVTLAFPDFAGPSATTGLSSINGALPVDDGIRPSEGVIANCRVKSGVDIMRNGVVIVNESGLIIFAKATGDEFYAAGFEATGNKGWHPFVVQYLV